MPEFTIAQQIAAPIETVWDVLHDFGDVQRWSDGVNRSQLTSEGPVGEGTTRHCDLAPFGGVEERIIAHDTHERFTVELYETSKMPISHGVADFALTRNDDGTEVAITLSYTPNTMGRMMKGTTEKQMRKGMTNLLKSLEVESKRLAMNA